MPDAIQRYYETTGQGYRMSSTRRERVLALLDEAIEALPAGEMIRIMDIGIGNGEIARHCRERFSDRDLSLIGVDISVGLLAAHRDLYSVTHAVNVDEETWTGAFPDVVQIVIASELVEHLFRPDLFFKSVRSIMAPDGYLILTTPNLLLWSRRVRFLFGQHAWSETGVDEWGHIHLFSWPFLSQQLAKNGFRIVATHHLLHPFFLNRWHRLLPPGLFAFQFVFLAQKH